jgi:hypothetical protein
VVVAEAALRGAQLVAVLATAPLQQRVPAGRRRRRKGREKPPLALGAPPDHWRSIRLVAAGSCCSGGGGWERGVDGGLGEEADVAAEDEGSAQPAEQLLPVVGLRVGSGLGRGARCVVCGLGAWWSRLDKEGFAVLLFRTGLKQVKSTISFGIYIVHGSLDG